MCAIGGEVQAGDGVEVGATCRAECKGIFGIEVYGESVGGIVLERVVDFRSDTEVSVEAVREIQTGSGGGVARGESGAQAYAFFAPLGIGIERSERADC